MRFLIRVAVVFVIVMAAREPALGAKLEGRRLLRTELGRVRIGSRGDRVDAAGLRPADELGIDHVRRRDLILYDDLRLEVAVILLNAAIVMRREALLQTLMRLPTLGLVLVRSVVMDDFKGRHFTGEVILWAVRWYCRYGISYRDLEEMLAERGIDVDHTTIYRWVQRYAPEMEKRLRWFWRRGFDPSWRLDETYVKVRGKWTYLYRAVDKRGDTIDFYLSPTRGAKAAKRFLGKTLRGLKDWEKPTKLNTDKAPSYGAAIAELKREGKLAPETEHRQVKYLNNVLEADHGKLKMLIKPVRGFKSMPTAYATIKGFEVMRALRKGQARAWCLQPGIRGEVRLIERSFGIGPSAMTEAMAMLNQHFNKAA